MQTLWAPWRMQYIGESSATGDSPACFLCAARAAGDDAAPLVLARTAHAFVIMNRFPYNCGHLMIAPVAHVGSIDEVTDEATILDLWRLQAVAKRALSETMRPEGFNLGINQGKCGGAGLRTHLHVHIVPRWEGDCNFMPVVADAKVLPQALDETYRVLRPAFDRLMRGAQA